MLPKHISLHALVQTLSSIPCVLFTTVNLSSSPNRSKGCYWCCVVSLRCQTEPFSQDISVQTIRPIILSSAARARSSYQCSRIIPCQEKTRRDSNVTSADRPDHCDENTGELSTAPYTTYYSTLNTCILLGYECTAYVWIKMLYIHFNKYILGYAYTIYDWIQIHALYTLGYVYINWMGSNCGQ